MMVLQMDPSLIHFTLLRTCLWKEHIIGGPIKILEKDPFEVAHLIHEDTQCQLASTGFSFFCFLFLVGGHLVGVLVNYNLNVSIGCVISGCYLSVVVVAIVIFIILKT